MPLADAAVAFAPRGLQRRFRRLSKKPRPEMSRDLVAAPDAAGVRAYLWEFLEDQQARSEPYRDMHASLLEELRAGRLEASGMRVPAVNGGEIETIPPRFFDERPRISWAHNTLRNFGIEFHRLRVRVRPAAAALPRSVNNPKKGPGRPSKDDEINRTIDRALHSGIDLNAMPRKQASDHIRKLAEELGLSTRLGFSESVVQRVLHRRFGPRY